MGEPVAGVQEGVRGICPAQWEGEIAGDGESGVRVAAWRVSGLVGGTGVVGRIAGAARVVRSTGSERWGHLRRCGGADERAVAETGARFWKAPNSKLQAPKSFECGVRNAEC